MEASEFKSESYLTVTELAQKARVVPGTIYRWKRKKLITYYQRGGKGGHLRFPLDAIEQCARLSIIDQPAETVTPSKPVKMKLPGRKPGWKSNLTHPNSKPEDDLG